MDHPIDPRVVHGSDGPEGRILEGRVSTLDFLVFFTDQLPGT